MTDAAIRVENLSKAYKVHPLKARHDTLRDHIADAAKRLVFGKHRPPTLSASEAGASEASFWALKNVSLDVSRGEVIGLIGRNGAGKSTLLKVLSRITDPTSGRAEIWGRVASLLEVGTGFHPELSGRENVYLNGSILGMRRKELARRFDEIVAFADIEKFIDTPVKHYSSGMYVRLAFAVAAHLDPDVLIVDEVLAVGDAMFQEKCLATLRSTASSGRTVLFVSHNMASIQHLCKRVVLLDEGRVAEDGAPRDVVRSYLSELSRAQDSRAVSVGDWPDRETNGQARIVEFEVVKGQDQAEGGASFGSTVRFRIVTEFLEPVVDPCFGVLVHDQTGEPILDLRSIHDGLRLGRVEGRVVVEVAVKTLGLYPGTYLLSPWVTDAGVRTNLDWPKLCGKLQVYPAPGEHGDLRLDAAWGLYWVPSSWTVS